jgi:hypothetical protein
MRIWIAWGSKRGGTEGIARMLAEDQHRLGARAEGDADGVRERARAVQELGARVTTKDELLGRHVGAWSNMHALSRSRPCSVI